MSDVLLAHNAVTSTVKRTVAVVGVAWKDLGLVFRV